LNWPCSPAAAGCPTRLCLAITFDPAGAALPACSVWDYANGATATAATAAAAAAAAAT